jgi:hypothetical protein
MSKYLTKDARVAGMKHAALLLDNAARAIGGSTSITEDVIRVRNAQDSTILSLYAPNPWGSPRWIVTGEFVPTLAGRRYRFSNRRSFWRGDALKAAQEALQYVRGTTPMEALTAERDRLLRDDERDYRGPKASELRVPYTSEAEMFGLQMYLQGHRSPDPDANDAMEYKLRQHEERLSDDLWARLLFWSFAPAIAALNPTV